MVAIGNQWFWTYEVTKVLKLVIECYLVKSFVSTHVGNLSKVNNLYLKLNDFRSIEILDPKLN